MKPRKQRLHSAELRRLDHIAGSLDRIADALEHLPDVIVSGNNDTVIYGNDDMAMRDMDIKAGEKTQIALHTINNAHGIDIENSQGVLVNGSNSSVVGSGNNQHGDGNVFAKQSPAVGSKIDSSHVSISGDCGASATGGATATAISDVKSSFNTNANDVVKDLTEALHRSTIQRSEQQNKNNEP